MARRMLCEHGGTLVELLVEEYAPLSTEVSMAEDMGHVNLLVTEDIATVADVHRAGVVMSDEDIHALGLVCVGGWYPKTAAQTTHWARPTGAD